MDSFENIFEYQLSETKEMLKMWFLVGGETTWKKNKVNSKFIFNLKLCFHRDLNVRLQYMTNISYSFSLWLNDVQQLLQKIFTDWWHHIHFNAFFQEVIHVYHWLFRRSCNLGQGQRSLHHLDLIQIKHLLLAKRIAQSNNMHKYSLSNNFKLHLQEF